jgi:hypothetical protein
MMSLRAAGVFVVALAVSSLVAWRVIITSVADRDALQAPERALAWDAHHPAALIALAWHQLAEHQPDAAAATARELLRVEPLAAQGFVLLAQAAEADGDEARAATLYEIAMRRAPRDLHARATIIDRQLRDAQYADALTNVDLLLGISPTQGATLLPALAGLAQAPAFADALAHALANRPAWRDRMLAVLLTDGEGSAVDQVYGPLQRSGRLSDEEAGRWYDWLMHSGRWGEVYSRWAGGLALAPGVTLAAVYNGGFESEPTGVGFDWRMHGAPGVVIERVREAGATGAYAAKVTFRGRRAPRIEFEQELLLSPGAHRLRFRTRSEDVRSDQGIEWAIACDGAGTPLAVSARLNGSSAWKAVETAFVVPAENCVAQRLWLRNPGADGAGKIVSGAIWFDDFAIDNGVDAAVPE